MGKKMEGTEQERNGEKRLMMTDRLQESMQYLNRRLAVDKSFDMLYRVIHIGGKEAAFYFIDGFCCVWLMVQKTGYFPAAA